MSLADGYTDLPNGKIANVVTCLRMDQRPPVRPDPPGVVCVLRHAINPDPRWYRDLFQRVGGPFLWFSRLAIDDDELLHIIQDPRVDVYSLELNGEDVGILELDFRAPGQCQLMFFGVTGDLVGKGVGRWLMNRAIDFAWKHPIEHFFVQTCTLDHPSALPFYIRSGFVPYKRKIEVADDPRTNGLLPRDIAPQIPLL